MTVTINGSTGVTTPDVTSDSYTGPISVSSSAPSNSLNVYASGNVGIGTSSPGAKLDVAIASGGLVQQLSGTSGVYTRLGTSTSSFYTVHNGTSDTFMYTQESAALRFGTSATERMRIDSSGNLLVGRTSASFGNTGIVMFPSGYMFIENSNADGISIRRSSGGAQIVFYTGSSTLAGTITSSGSTTAYNSSSDYRLKHDIAPMTGALAKVAALKPCTYKWNTDNSEGEGFIAHELAEVCPQAVTGAKDAVDADGKPVYQGIDTSFLVATLTAAIQEQQTQISDQLAIINAQQTALTDLTARIVALEAK